MHDRAVRPNDRNANLVVLGDFNLDGIGDPLYEAFIAAGLWPPTELNTVQRTIFDDDKIKHFDDQLAWFSQPDGSSLLKGLAYGQRAGTFAFIPHVFPGLTPERVVVADLRPLPALVRIPTDVRERTFCSTGLPEI